MSQVMKLAHFDVTVYSCKIWRQNNLILSQNNFIINQNNLIIYQNNLILNELTKIL